MDGWKLGWLSRTTAARTSRYLLDSLCCKCKCNVSRNVLPPSPPWYGIPYQDPVASLRAPCRPPEAGPTPPSVGYGHVECITGPRVPRLDVVPARSGSEHLPKPPSMGPVNKVCDGIDDCVRARSFVSPYAKDMSNVVVDCQWDCPNFFCVLYVMSSNCAPLFVTCLCPRRNSVIQC